MSLSWAKLRKLACQIEPVEIGLKCKLLALRQALCDSLGDFRREWQWNTVFMVIPANMNFLNLMTLPWRGVASGGGCLNCDLFDFGDWWDWRRVSELGFLGLWYWKDLRIDFLRDVCDMVVEGWIVIYIKLLTVVNK